MQRIKTLPPAVARKIAAGEVIEKPASVLRELLDNAIDSGATEIDIHLFQGGLKEIRVSDNGCGMSLEDLKNSILPHATSKIKEAEDLYALHTLGFRGEALASITACARVTITSKEAESPIANLILCEEGTLIKHQSIQANNGTTVSVKDLFYSIPGRKKFMKSTQGEALACLNIFFEKAAAFPQVSFRYFSENQLQYFLPSSTLLERITLLYKKRIPIEYLKEYKCLSENQITLTFIGSTPSSFRRDRKQIHIFINNRKIQEFALMQAVEYGYSEILPGGCFPIFFLFIQMDPAKIDFNIHPAKKEVKIQETQLLRSSIINGIKKFLKPFRSGNSYVEAAKRIEKLKSNNNPDLNFTWTPPIHAPQKESEDEEILPSLAFQNECKEEKSFSLQHSPFFGTSPLSKTSTDFSETAFSVAEKEAAYTSSFTEEIYQEKISPPKEEKKESFEAQFLAVFKALFLIAKKGDTLYLIDQHAAHERILFDEMVAHTEKQNLLIPIPITPNEGEENPQFQQEEIDALAAIGITVKKEQEGKNPLWLLHTLPSGIYQEAIEVARLLRDLPKEPFEIQKKLFATIACRKAVKEGDIISKEFAQQLVEKSIALPKPNCPHGRPVFFTLTFEELCQLVGRDTTPF